MEAEEDLPITMVMVANRLPMVADRMAEVMVAATDTALLVVDEIGNVVKVLVCTMIGSDIVPAVAVQSGDTVAGAIETERVKNQGLIRNY